MNKTFIKKQQYIGVAVKILFSFLIVFIFSDDIKSQTTLNSNLYFTNKYQLNPAYAGSEGSIYSVLDYRNTNSYSQGSPTSFNLDIHSPIFNNMGAGIRLSNNKEGLFNNTNLFVDYSYKVNFKSNHNIRFGISAGLEANQMNYSEIIAEDPAAIIEVASKNYVGNSFETSAGISYNWKNLDISFSLPQLFENKNKLGLSYLGLISYDYQLKKQEINLKPSVLLIQNNNSEINYNINLQTIWKNKYWFGIAYKNRPAFVFSAGISMYNFSVGYAIEIGTEKYSNIFKQIHEISIAYSFGRNKKPLNDSIFVNNDFDLKQDTTKTKIDSTEIAEKIIKKENNSSDSTKTKENIVEKEEKTNIQNNINIEETANGIYILKINTSDSSEAINKLNDSLLIKTIIKEINKEKDTLKYVEVSHGLYRIKNIKTNKFIDTDSISETKLNSLSIKLEENNNNYQTTYYTIIFYINDSTKHLLYKPDIIEKTNAKLEPDGTIKYFYGHFETKEEALKQLQKLKQLGIKIKIKKVSSF